MKRKIFYHFQIFYLNQFEQDPKFLKMVGLNGGEIMTAYKYHSPSYIPTIIQECVNRNYRVDLRTNALWTEDNTINSIIWKSLFDIDFSKYTNKISFSLSIDKFHNNELANQNLISKICNSKLQKYFEITAYLIPDNFESTQITSNTFQRLFRLLSENFILSNKINCQKMDRQDIPTRYHLGILLNDVPFLLETHNIGRWGRAKEFGIGEDLGMEHHIKSHFDIFNHTTDKIVYNSDKNHCIKPIQETINVSFSYDGTVDFIVPVERETSGIYYTDGNKCKPWSQLYSEMVENQRVKFETLKKKYPNISPELVGLNEILTKLQLTR